MDILAQVANVVAQAEAASRQVTLTLDLDQPSHRAAYAAALAVLQVCGADLSEPEVSASGAPSSPAARGAAPGAPATEMEELDDELRRRFAAAIAELTPDEAKRAAIVNDTFPRVRELLRDGANVEAVAQIQYRRWLEEHLDAERRN